MSRRSRTGPARRMLVVLAALALFAGACSQDDTSSGTAPEDQRATPAEVTAGLRKIDGFAKEIAAQTEVDKAKATAADAQIEPQWAIIEGTVKANDKDMYLGFEDNFALLEDAAKSGDVAKAARGAAGVSKGVSDYLARYPG